MPHPVREALAEAERVHGLLVAGRSRLVHRRSRVVAAEHSAAAAAAGGLLHDWILAARHVLEVLRVAEHAEIRSKLRMLLVHAARAPATRVAAPVPRHAPLLERIAPHTAGDTHVRAVSTRCMYAPWISVSWIGKQHESPLYPLHMANRSSGCAYDAVGSGRDSGWRAARLQATYGAGLGKALSTERSRRPSGRPFLPTPCPFPSPPAIWRCAHLRCPQRTPADSRHSLLGARSPRQPGCAQGHRDRSQSAPHAR